MRVRNFTWLTSFALYSGKVDPSIPSGFVGRVFTETNGRCNPRVLDKHGHQLSLFTGKGHGKVAAHNLLVATAMHVSQQVGLTASNQLQVMELFADAIPGPGKALYRMSAKQQKDGIAPDIRLTNFASEPGQMVGMQLLKLYEVKGLGYVRVGPCAYVHSATPAAAAKEQLVPAQYEALASRADRKYFTTPQGIEGPIATKLRTGFTGAEGLAFSAFLELGQGFHRQIGKNCTQGIDVPSTVWLLPWSQAGVGHYCCLGNPVAPFSSPWYRYIIAYLPLDWIVDEYSRDVSSPAYFWRELDIHTLQRVTTTQRIPE